jgi:hypothetical protein
MPECIAAGADTPQDGTSDWATWYANFRRVRSGPNAVPPANTAPEHETVYIGHMDTGYTEHSNLDATRIDSEIGANLVEGKLRDARTPIEALPVWHLGESSLQNHGTATMSVVIGTSPIKDACDDIMMAPYRVSVGVFLLTGDLKRLATAIGLFTERMLNERGGGAPYVVSMSLGTRGSNMPVGSFTGKDTLRKVIRDYTNLGVIFVAAAGQFPPFALVPSEQIVLGTIDELLELYKKNFKVVFPASMKEVIGVGSIDIHGKPNLAGYYDGAEIDVMAPGMDIRMARSYRRESGALNSRVETSDGSSYATQYTAAAAAMWIRHHGKHHLRTTYGLDRITDVFRHCLHASSSPAHPDWWDLTKAGRLNLDCLLRHPLPTIGELG